ncbi:MAG: hypothetical protein AB7H70_09260 [Rhodospirillaceae bacterium]
MVRRTLLGIALGAVVIGAIWIGQGTGVFPYPASSFMIDQMPWAYRGAALAAAGVIAVIFLRRK